MANLSLKQQKIIQNATKEQLELWMDELYPAISNRNFEDLYKELNKERLRRDGIKA